MKETKLHHRPIYTQNTKLASALNALGVKMQKPYWSKITDAETGNIEVTWFFEPKSNCKTYNTADLIKWWNSDEWYVENYPKKHPFALIICAMETKEFLTDKIKESKGHIKIKRKNKDWIVAENSDLHQKLINE